MSTFQKRKLLMHSTWEVIDKNISTIIETDLQFNFHFRFNMFFQLFEEQILRWKFVTNTWSGKFWFENVHPKAITTATTDYNFNEHERILSQNKIVTAEF